jgi:hypothetical protein
VAAARRDMPLFDFESWVSRWETALALAVRASAAAAANSANAHSTHALRAPHQHIVSFSQASTTVYRRDHSTAEPLSASAAAALEAP